MNPIPYDLEQARLIMNSLALRRQSCVKMKDDLRKKLSNERYAMVNTVPTERLVELAVAIRFIEQEYAELCKAFDHAHRLHDSLALVASGSLVTRLQPDQVICAKCNQSIDSGMVATVDGIRYHQSCAPVAGLTAYAPAPTVFTAEDGGSPTNVDPAYRYTVTLYEVNDRWHAEITSEQTGDAVIGPERDDNKQAIRAAWTRLFDGWTFI